MANITYLDSNVLTFTDYSITIPDGFMCKKNLEGRDFIAWLPSPQNKDSYLDSQIVIFAGKLLKDIEIDPKMPPIAFSSLAHNLFWQTRSPFSIFEEEYFIPLNQGYPAGGITAAFGNNAFHYNFTVFTKKGAKMMRILVNNVTWSQKDYYDSFATEWISKMVLADSFEEPTGLTNTRFFENLTPKTAKEWTETLNYKCNLITFIQNNEIASAVSKVKLNTGTGGFSQRKGINDFKKEVQQLLDQSATRGEDLMNETLLAIEKYSELYPSNVLLVDIYNAAIEAFKDTVYSATSADGVAIKSPIKQASTIKAKFKTVAIGKLIDDEKKEKARIAAEEAEKKRIEEERKRIEAEKKAAEEAERLRKAVEIYEKEAAEVTKAREAYIAAETDNIEEKHKRAMSALKSDYDSSCEKNKKEIETASVEKSRLEQELAQTGIFAFRKKKQLRSDIETLSEKLQHLSNAKRELDTSYESARAKQKSARESALSVLPMNAGKKHPMPKDPRK